MAEIAEKHVWRFQADPAVGEKDPPVTVFLGELETRNGQLVVRQDVRNPVTLKLSELVTQLAIPGALAELQETQAEEGGSHGSPL